MEVELVAITQPVNKFVPNLGIKNPLEVVERCAAVCYDSKPTKEYKITKNCHKSGHDSVLEHISFTFHISKVSRALLAQLSRHRHISLSVKSQRYCKMDNANYAYMPELVVLSGHLGAELVDDYNATIDFSFNTYNKLVDVYKLPKEDARMVLPNACCTELYMTANARALIEMSHLRLCARAQQEIRDMFKLIKKEVKEYCPEVAEYMVPTCETHEIPYCSEGKPCGKYPKLKQIIGEEKNV